MIKRLILAWLLVLCALFTWLPDASLRANPQYVFAGFRAPSGGTPTTVTYASQNCAGTSADCTFSNVTLHNFLGGVVGRGNTTDTLTSVCDGSGTGGCTGSSTYTIKPVYKNGSSFESYVWYTCDAQNAGSNIVVQFTWSGGTGGYSVGDEGTGNSTTGCEDQFAQGQGASGTTYTSGTTATTTNANDLLLGFIMSWSGASALSAGSDGQGNTMTLDTNSSNVAGVEHYNETAKAAYAAAASGPNAAWNMHTLAVK